jgi:hypothetical protein
MYRPITQTTRNLQQGFRGKDKVVCQRLQYVPLSPPFVLSLNPVSTSNIFIFSRTIPPSSHSYLHSTRVTSPIYSLRPLHTPLSFRSKVEANQQSSRVLPSLSPMFPMPTLLGWVNLSGSESFFLFLCWCLGESHNHWLGYVAPGYVLEYPPTHVPFIPSYILLPSLDLLPRASRISLFPFLVSLCSTIHRSRAPRLSRCARLLDGSS